MKLALRFVSAAAVLGSAAVLPGCIPPPQPTSRIPAIEYAERIKEDYALRHPEYRAQLNQERALRAERDGAFLPAAASLEGQAKVKFIAGEEIPAGGTQNFNLALDKTIAADDDGFAAGDNSAVTNLGVDGQVSEASSESAGYQVYRNKRPNTRDYTGPLSLGDAGLSASLWRESGAATNLFRDYRAWQPMDLITIVVSEDSQAKNKADTTIKQESSIAAGIKAFFGLEHTIGNWNDYIKPSQLIESDAQHDYKGQGETKREGTLKANISAMVMEVLPSGVLRIEGEKIIVVNNDDQIMRISGLVRPEDVTSNNEVDSSKVANVRIDYFGKGSVGNAQNGGWLGNLIRRFWPL